MSILHPFAITEFQNLQASSRHSINGKNNLNKKNCLVIHSYKYYYRKAKNDRRKKSNEN